MSKWTVFVSLRKTSDTMPFWISCNPLHINLQLKMKSTNPKPFEENSSRCCVRIRRPGVPVLRWNVYIKKKNILIIYAKWSHPQGYYRRKNFWNCQICLYEHCNWPLFNLWRQENKWLENIKLNFEMMKMYSKSSSPKQHYAHFDKFSFEKFWNLSLTVLFKILV